MEQTWGEFKTQHISEAGFSPKGLGWLVLGFRDNTTEGSIRATNVEGLFGKAGLNTKPGITHSKQLLSDDCSQHHHSHFVLHI